VEEIVPNFPAKPLPFGHFLTLFNSLLEKHESKHFSQKRKSWIFGRKSAVQGQKWVGCGESAERGVGEGHSWVRQGRLRTAEGNQVGHMGQLHLTGERVTIAFICRIITYILDAITPQP
jgi:hypothetical protein